jgi:cytochrome P450
MGMTQQKADHPPGPRPGWFGFSILSGFQKDPLSQLDRLHRDHGDTVSYRIGPYRQYLFFHPDQVRELLVSKARAFRRFPHPMRVLGQWNGESMLIAEGQQWLRKRRLVQPALQPKRLEGYLPAIWAEALKQCDRWQRLLVGAEGEKTTLDVQPAMNGLTLAVIAQTMFASDLGAESEAIGAAVATLSQIGVEEFSSPFILPRWVPTARNRRKNAAIAVLDRVVRRMIDEHAGATAPGSDLLSGLLTHLETDPDGTRHQLDREEIRNEVMTLLLAGHDTTAAGLIWTLYHLAANPKIQDRLGEEVDGVLGRRSPTLEDIGQMKLLDRVVKESLRLHPPAIGVFMRQTLEDVEIGGWLLRRGALAGAYSWVVHRDPRWFPEPEQFDPDRFLPERFAELPLGSYFPFGTGPRMCIGSAMATLEIQAVVAAFVQRFRFAVPAGAAPPRPVALMSLRPEGGMPLVLSRRAGQGAAVPSQGEPAVSGRQR